MNKSHEVNVTGRDGLRGTLDTAAWPVDGSRKEVLLHLEDGREVMIASNALDRQPDGSYRVSFGATDLDRLTAALGEHASESKVVPVIAEEAQVDVRKVVTGRVRVDKTVTVEEQIIDKPLLREEVSVERVPVNQWVPPGQDLPASRQEGDVLILPVVEEVLVVEKRLRVKEEIRITRKRTEVRAPQSVKLRREEVKIEKIPAAKEGSDGTGVA